MNIISEGQKITVMIHRSYTSHQLVHNDCNNRDGKIRKIFQLSDYSQYLNSVVKFTD